MKRARGLLLLVLLALSRDAHATTLSFPVTIDLRPGAPAVRILNAGDSYVAGYGNGPGIGTGYLAPLCARIQAAQIHAHDSPGLVAMANRTVRDPGSYLVTCIQDGKSGAGIGDYVTTDAGVPRYVPRIIAHSPTLIFLHVSQNDWFTPPATWTANATATFNAVDAALPTVTVIVISNFYGGSEQWTAGGWDVAVADNDETRALNVTAKAWVATRDPARYIWLNLRGDAITDPNTVLNWESTHNAPAPGVTNGIGFDTTGHPVKGFGYTQLSNMIWSRLNVVTN